jgi:hypothetical protein
MSTENRDRFYLDLQKSGEVSFRQFRIGEDGTIHLICETCGNEFETAISSLGTSLDLIRHPLCEFHRMI